MKQSSKKWSNEGKRVQLSWVGSRMPPVWCLGHASSGNTALQIKAI